MKFTKRLVIILDALRKDTMKEILLPEFPGVKVHEMKSIDNYTEPFFREMAPLIECFNGWKGVICGGGLAAKGFSKDNLHFYFSSQLSPLLNIFSILPKEVTDWNEWQPIEGNALFVIHCYFIHNYWTETSIPSPVLWRYLPEADRVKLRQAYEKRTRYVVPILKELFEAFSSWDKFITADHGEAFWEDGKDWYHHSFFSCIRTKTDGYFYTYENNPHVLDTWIMDFQNNETMTQHDLFKKSEETGFMVVKNTRIEDQLKSLGYLS